MLPKQRAASARPAVANRRVEGGATKTGPEPLRRAVAECTQHNALRNGLAADPQKILEVRQTLFKISRVHIVQLAATRYYGQEWRPEAFVHGAGGWGVPDLPGVRRHRELGLQGAHGARAGRERAKVRGNFVCGDFASNMCIDVICGVCLVRDWVAVRQ